MKQLIVPHISELQQDSPLPLISKRLDMLSKQQIDIAPWSVSKVNPATEFILAHNSKCLFLKYNVRESTVLARYRNTNDPVYKDSCVEFFVSFGEDPAYYNLETNCMGTCLLGYGKSRQDRQLLSKETVAQIRYFANLKVAKTACNEKNWQLTMVIPATVFAKHELSSFTGQKAKANFYKCGDDLPLPHYLAWHPIEAPEPDFHRPEHFGQVTFS